MASSRIQESSVSNDIIVNVSFKSHQKSYELDRSSTVAELRQRLATDHSVSVPQVKILLGGSVLADHMTIEGSGVGMQSTLFAILCTSTSSSEGADRTAFTETDGQQLSSATTSSPAGDNDDCAKQLLDQYFVYCKLCGEVQPGRLRVKCSVCEGGAVLVDKDPSCWEDIRIPGRLSGTCQMLACEQCIPIFYFKCVKQHLGDVNDTVVALHHIKPNRRSVLCITCEDVMNPVVVFPCQSSHVMCLDCFMKYCTVRLYERQFVQHFHYGYTLPCPAGCPNSYIQEQHHFCMMGQKEYDLYKDLAAEECLLAAGGIFCPRQECGSGFLLDAGHDVRVICPHCKFLFCRNCGRESHYDECRPQTSVPRQEFSDPERAARAQWEQQTAHTIQETTKACPGCGTRTERDGGCMHMACARCGGSWCWLCEKTWDRECQGAHWFG